mgnify:CR=1 FL=1|jgi:hypothetical protein
MKGLGGRADGPRAGERLAIKGPRGGGSPTNAPPRRASGDGGPPVRAAPPTRKDLRFNAERYFLSPMPRHSSPWYCSVPPSTDRAEATISLVSPFSNVRVTVTS